MESHRLNINNCQGCLYGDEVWRKLEAWRVIIYLCNYMVACSRERNKFSRFNGLVAKDVMDVLLLLNDKLLVLLDPWLI